MRYGPELVSVMTTFLSKELDGVKVGNVEGGPDWLILQSRRKAIFLSWNQDNFGVSILNDKEVKLSKNITDRRSSFHLVISKHLSGARFVEFEQISKDRLISIKLQKFIGAGVPKDYYLIIELMGRLSNVILLDSDKNIIESAKHIHPDINRYRSILPGLKYTTPPPLVGAVYSGESNLEQYLNNPIGIGKTLAKELKELLVDLSSSKIFFALEQLKSENHKLIIQMIVNYITIFPLKLPNSKVIEGDLFKLFKNLTFNPLLEKKRMAISQKGKKIIAKEKKSLRRHIDGLKRQLNMASEANSMMLAGQVIYANLNTIPKGTTRIDLPYWDEEGNQTEITVKLDPSLLPAENAEKYFKKYRKYTSNTDEVKEKLSDLMEQEEQLEVQASNLDKLEDLNTLDDMVKEIVGHHNKNKQKRKNKRDVIKPPHLRYEIGSSIILVGLNERGNRYVTFKEARGDDLWFHVHEAPGSHVILKSPPADKDLLEKLTVLCSSLALYYSKISNTPNHFVDFTKKKHVRHIQGAGPAQVTYKNSDTRGVTPDIWRSLLEELE